jgi:hypothetical protein
MLKGDRVLDCEVRAHASGHEVRVYLGGDLYYSRLDAAPQEAETQAADLKHALLADGWTEAAPSGSERPA